MYKGIRYFGDQCRERKIPIISPNTETFLHKLISIVCPTSVLEVGSAVGYSALFRSQFSSVKHIVSFEKNFFAYQECLFHQHIFAIDKVSFYPFSPLDIDLSFLSSGRDIFFIDGMKKQYIDYFLNLETFSSENSLWIFDDTIMFDHKIGPLNQVLSDRGYHIQQLRLDENDGITLASKNLSLVRLL